MGATPHLRLDTDILDRNIAAMAALAAERGIALRPHAKTHKSLQIARRQLDAGASGLTVATIGEAEVFAAAGFDDLFIAYPLWLGAGDADRLRALAGRARVLVGCDSPEAARRLSRLPVEVAVEIDSGHHRSGVQPREAGELAARISESGLRVRGVFTFPGHSYSPETRLRAADDEAAALAVAAASLAAALLPVRLLSGGSTPSAGAVRPGVLNELRPGVYVFGDSQQVELGTIGFDQVALTVAATVVSHTGGRVVTDAGSKALGADRAPWASGFGRVLDAPDARIVALSEHHSTIEWPGARPALGSTVLVVPNHVCNAVNLAGEYRLSTGGTWPVAARGRNS
ncbi:MAG: alanine racemase [Actinobacteria bacterium]|nr:alanine racemase [Actinomycetota bacterium]